ISDRYHCQFVVVEIESPATTCYYRFIPPPRHSGALFPVVAPDDCYDEPVPLE
ncbi:hypothetical protein A2U01_0016739, partial [Trifolium medium]|nr:hypothetical protein [Trifolium medium]